MLTPLLLFVAGLLALFFGAHLLIMGASRMARDLGISGLVIGLTVVAMGTSMPELVVGIIASVQNSPDIAIGNVLGSNIANIALILGLAAIIRPIPVQMRLPAREVPIMIGASLLFYLFALDGILTRSDGGALLAGLIIYTIYLLRGSRTEAPKVEAEYKWFISPGGTLAGHIVLTVLGSLILLVGAYSVVNGVAHVALLLGVSELAVGLTVVALGTSLPELATAVAASVQNEGDILLGNVVGSNVFNVLAVLGIASMARPMDVSRSVMTIEAPVMLAVSVLLLPFVWTALRLTRLEGGLLVATYAAFVIWVALPN